MEKQELMNQSPTPAALISQAVERNIDLEKLEKLMEMQVVWEKREAAKAFNMAMSKFQQTRPKLVKDSKVEFRLKDGGTTKFSFKTLASIQAVVDPIIGKNGLSYRWEQNQENDKIKVTCVVSHVNGHEERTSLSAGADVSGKKNNIQAIGSTVSYLKKYTLEGIFGLSSDIDDDGKGSITQGDGTKPFLKDDLVKTVMAKIKNNEINGIEDITKHFSLSAEQKKLFSSIIKAKKANEGTKNKPKSN